MTNHRQQQEHGPNDAVDEHGNEQQEGEEARAPLEVDDDYEDEHQRNEDDHREVDVLCIHAAASHAHKKMISNMLVCPCICITCTQENDQ